MSGEFDFDGEAAARDEAIEAAYQASYEGWRAAAHGAVLELAGRGEEFISDDVWRELERRGITFAPREPRALGGVMLRAARAGVIVKVGNRESARAGCHRNLTGVWRKK